MSDNNIEVRIGQRWRDRDKRMLSGNRVRTVVGFVDGKAVLDGGATQTRVSLANLRKRWKLES